MVNHDRNAIDKYRITIFFSVLSCRVRQLRREKTVSVMHVPAVKAGMSRTSAVRYRRKSITGMSII
ncbi:hypothetical protein FACS1894145_3640 [Bacteroidia bacterium]|nr:hypothetical protein FACS1894145_3640 [Bacteroidia bacterium]